MSRHDRAQYIWAMLKSYMLDECSLECAAVGNDDDKNLINLIMNSLPSDPAQCAPEPTAAQIDAALNAWFSVKPSAAESDAVLERSMKAALIAARGIDPHKSWEQEVRDAYANGFADGKLAHLSPPALSSTEGK